MTETQDKVNLFQRLSITSADSTRQACCLNAAWFSGNIRSVVQIFGNILYYISLILLELLSNYILIKLWQEIGCPEIAKQNVAALASIRSLPIKRHL